MYQAVFKRYEFKYLLNNIQANALKLAMIKYMVPDQYGNTDVCNLYFDTPDFLLARRSIEKPCYKEKLRLRCYGVASPDRPVFPELKKKYESVVYKRRLEMPECKAMDCLTGRQPFPDTQIGREISYCFTRYPALQPKVYLSYERQAFYGKFDDDFRMTFDTHILWRDTDLSLCSPVYGNGILGEDTVLLEVKTSTALPLWLVRFFSENRIYKTSFSKYGTAYKALNLKCCTQVSDECQNIPENKTTVGGIYCA
jgi:hypothetical protein